MARAVQVRSVKTRESILVAAEALLGREGVKSLTMDAVATEAGFSKGAVLHHFRSKEALIAGMVSRELGRVRAGRQVEGEALEGQPNRYLRSTIRQSARRYADKGGFPTTLMVPAIENSNCLDEIRAYGDDTFRRIRADSNAPDEATVLGYAAFGLLIARALGFASYDVEAGRQLFETLERMAVDLGSI